MNAYSLKTQEDTIKGVIEEGRTWIIARDGLFRRDGKYFIAKHMLWEGNDGYGWEQQVEDKGHPNYDCEDFVVMLAKARTRFESLRKTNA